MRVERGGFGFAEPTPNVPTRVPQPNNAHLHAVAELGATMIGVGEEAMRRKRVEEDAAQRSAATAELVAFKNDAYDLSREVETGLSEGTIKREDAAEYLNKSMTTLRTARLQNIAPPLKPDVDATFNQQQLQYRAGMDRKLDEMRQSEIGANITRTGEELDRSAVRDPYGASKQFRTLLDELGPKAGISPQDIEIRANAFRERALTNHIVQQINESENSRKSLETLNKRLSDDKTYTELDPAQKNQLRHTVTSMIEQLDNRARIAQDAHLRRLEMEFNSYTGVAEAGKPLSPHLVADASRRFKGTPFEKPFAEVVHMAASNGAFTSQPLPVQNEALLQESARLNAEGATPLLLKRYEARQRAFEETKRDYQANSLQTAIDHRVVADIPRLNLDLGNPESMKQELAARLRYVTQVESWSGMPAQPLFPEEADLLSQYLKAQTPKARAKTLGQLTTALESPERARKLFAQIGKDEPELGIIGYIASKGHRTYYTTTFSSEQTPGRDLAAMAAEGFHLLREKQVDLPADLVPRVQKELHGVYTTVQGQDTATQAVTAFYASLMRESGSYKESSATSSRIQTAIKYATGGIYNGRHGKLPKPIGWSVGEFDDRMNTFTAQDLERLGGTLEMPEAQAARYLRGARLQSAGDGRYVVEYGAGLLRRRVDGRPLVIELEDR